MENVIKKDENNLEQTSKTLISKEWILGEIATHQERINELNELLAVFG